MNRKRVFNATLVLAAGLFGAQSLLAREVADTIYSGGPILTINDAQPKAEAVAVRNGRILAVGNKAAINRYRGNATVDFNLGGRAMLPGFVDSHGHVAMGGLQAYSANLLAPPDGPVSSIPALQAALREWAKANAGIVDNKHIIFGFGYDNSQLAELRHPTRWELDEVSQDVPIVVMHQSAHIGVVNSKALEILKIDSKTPDPPGGVIQHDKNGEPNGLLEETAFFSAKNGVIKSLGVEGLRAFIRGGADLWASYGYTTAQDGRSAELIVTLAREVNAKEGLPIDIVAFPDVLEQADYIAKSASRQYVNRVRVGGCKLSIDGSPQGFTAFRDRPYFAPVGDYPKDYAGYSRVSEEQLREAVDFCFKNKLQILTHANGEGASDMLIGALKGARSRYGDPGNRPVLIHGQFLREDQVDSFQKLGVFPSLFPMHTFYWGDWHRDHTVGPVNAENISPTGWLVKRNMKFGTHHDAPVAFPDSMRVLAATVTRVTRSGRILGADQRVDVKTALKAMTIWPAWQHFEEARKGSIEVGKLADFAILSADPTAVDPQTLADLKVVFTIKEGVVVYDARDKRRPVRSSSRPFLGDPEAAHMYLHAMYEGMDAIAPKAGPYPAVPSEVR
jgi:predicted amidohydrolase YtcJ